MHFNSRPHGGRQHFVLTPVSPLIFQLTPSRRATLKERLVLVRQYYFNSRPHGGRRKDISHHSASSVFQLTPSRRATRKSTNYTIEYNISTHALTEGDFNLPCGMRSDTFQLTPSRRATTSILTCAECGHISTHALTEGDTRSAGNTPGAVHFNSRPHGGRQYYLTVNQNGIYISTHALTEGDCLLNCFRSLECIFQLTPSRRATRLPAGSLWNGNISTHALTEGDGKFRQIFLLNRGYAYSISLYFLPHFISLLPQILSFQQKSFKFQVRIFLLFSVHLAFALQNQCVHHVKSRFCTNMFYFVFVLFTQIVKPQTIGLFIYDFF